VGLAGKEIKRQLVALDSLGPHDDDVGHLVNWLRVMEARKDPNATVEDGFSHAIVWIMCPLLLERQKPVLESKDRKLPDQHL
jgi:hypothetical protein